MTEDEKKPDSEPRELLDHWQDYRVAVLAPNNPPDFTVEIRRGFFAGAHCLMYELAKVRELPEGQKQERLALLDRELAAFQILARDGLDRPHPDDLTIEEPKRPRRGRKKQYNRYRLLNGDRVLAGTYKHRATVERKVERMNNHSESTGCGRRYRMQGRDPDGDWHDIEG